MKINNKFARTISVLLALTMIFSVLMCAPFTANAASNGEYTYEVIDDLVEITGYKGKSTAVYIPEKINGKSVFSIAEGAFMGNKNITKIVIPDSVYYVDNNAFKNCVNLSSFKISKNLLCIGKDVFYNTAYYNDKNNWKDGALYIGTYLIKFDDTKKIIIIKEGTTVIADYAFYESDVKNCAFPDTLISIGNFAFYNCSLLNAELKCSDYFFFIGESAFEKSNLRSVSMSDGLEHIGKCAFKDSSVESARLPADIEYIAENLFWGSDLESIKIPDKVKYIDYGAFTFTPIKEISIPKSVEYIGPWAFNGADLTKINLPDKYIEFDKSVFEQTDYLRSKSNWSNGGLYVGNYLINVDNEFETLKIKEGTKYLITDLCNGYTNLEKIIIPGSVERIGSRAFLDCGMDSVAVPSSVKYIGDIALGVVTGPEIDKYYYKEPFELICVKDSTAYKYAQAYGIKCSTKTSAKSISLNRSTLSLGVGETYTLIDTVKPDSAAVGCKWTSSNSAVASVDGNGKVTAKKAGTATITVKTSNGLSKSCKVTVKPAPSSIKVSTSNLSLGVGEEFIISESTNSGSYAWKFSWSSSNSKVATVTKTSGNKAKIVAKGTGTTNITVKTYNGKTAVCKVTVKPAPTSVSLTSSNITLGKGETFIIAQNSNSGSYAKNFTWSSSNTNVATVAKTSGNKAKITAKNNGTAYIKIKTYNGKTATCKVTVKNAPSSVKTNPKSVTLGVGETYTVSESTNSGTYANASNLSWSSSNSSVAVVTKGSGNKAVITAKRAGTANITIKLYNGKTASCKVTVKPAPSSVKVNPSNVNLQVGETYTVSEITNSGSYANASNLKWSSSDSSVATVTKGSGNKAVITAKKAGTAKITIRLYNGKTAVCTVTVSENEFSQQINRVVQLVNVQRAKVGLQPLTADKSLNSVALIRATEIVKSFSHTRPNGSYFHTVIDENNIHYGHAGENIAKGAVDADKVMELWMNSEGHRNNILSKNYNKIGVACYEYGGTYHWVQIFTD